MTDALAFSGVIQSLSALAQLGKALVGIHDAEVIKDKVIELNGEILSAQASALAAQADQFALLERVRGLEEQVAELEAWNAEAKRYELTNLRAAYDPRGPVFVYALKKEAGSSEPTHQLCTHCYENRHKSILQHERLYPGAAEVLVCHHCSSVFYLNGHREPEHVAQFPKRSSH